MTPCPSCAMVTCVAGPRKTRKPKVGRLCGLDALSFLITVRVPWSRVAGPRKTKGREGRLSSIDHLSFLNTMMVPWSRIAWPRKTKGRKGRLSSLGMAGLAVQYTLPAMILKQHLPCCPFLSVPCYAVVLNSFSCVVPVHIKVTAAHCC